MPIPKDLLLPASARDFPDVSWRRLTCRRLHHSVRCRQKRRAKASISDCRSVGTIRNAFPEYPSGALFTFPNPSGVTTHSLIQCVVLLVVLWIDLAPALAINLYKAIVRIRGFVGAVARCDCAAILLFHLAFRSVLLAY